MDPTPLRNGEPTDFIDNGAVRRAMVHLRAHELAVIAGHVEPYVSQENYEQAKHELANDAGGHRPQTEHQSSLAMQQWDPIPGSFDHRIPDLSSAELGEAEHDQMIQTVHYTPRTAEGPS
jgi:hypothetical protein